MYLLDTSCTYLTRHTLIWLAPCDLGNTVGSVVLWSVLLVSWWSLLFMTDSDTLRGRVVQARIGQAWTWGMWLQCVLWHHSMRLQCVLWHHSTRLQCVLWHHSMRLQCVLWHHSMRLQCVLWHHSMRLQCVLWHHMQLMHFSYLLKAFSPWLCRPSTFQQNSIHTILHRVVDIFLASHLFILDRNKALSFIQWWSCWSSRPFLVCCLAGTIIIFLLFIYPHESVATREKLSWPCE